MKNDNSFWDIVSESVADLSIFNMSETATVWMVVAVIAVVMLIVWLILRKVRLWYWQTNTQIDTLKSIEETLHEVADKLVQAQYHYIDEAEDDTEDTAEEEEELSPGTFWQHFEPKELPENAVMGRSGTIYTEEELESQIKD